MPAVPLSPKVFHITHIDNLAGILQAGGIWSDGQRVERALGSTLIGMNSIKQRRLHRLRVDCHPGTMVGEYVPFYFCPRSIMLYILHMANHPDLTYHGGQRPILHFQADMMAAVRWAQTNARPWAFTDRNAGATYASFYWSMDDLDKIQWDAVNATDFRNPEIKEGKQAEFLLHEFFPWELVECVGVFDAAIRDQVKAVLAPLQHRPPVQIWRDWYY